MLKKAKEYCKDCLRLSGGYFTNHLHREYGTSRTADFIHMRLAVGWTWKGVVEEIFGVKPFPKYVSHFVVAGFQLS